MARFYLLILASILSLLGCKSTPVVQESVTEAVTPAIPNLPQWVYSPDREGYLMVVGSAPSQKMSSSTILQERVATVQARAELSKLIKLWIYENIEVTTDKDSSGKVTRDYNQSSIQQSSQLLDINQAQVFDRFIDDAGTMYILYGLPTR